MLHQRILCCASASFLFTSSLFTLSCKDLPHNKFALDFLLFLDVLVALLALLAPCHGLARGEPSHKFPSKVRLCQ